MERQCNEDDIWNKLQLFDIENNEKLFIGTLLRLLLTELVNSVTAKYVNNLLRLLI